MKKNCFSCFILSSLALASTNIAWSQGQQGYAKLKLNTSFEDHIPLSKQAGPAKGSGYIFRNNISTRVVRSFIRSFDDIADAKWYPSANGYHVYFKKDGVRTKVHYSRSGELISMIRYYYEDKLAPEIRHLVKSSYYDFTILSITEWRTGGQTVYEIRTEDKGSFKIIKVMNGEIESVTDFLKA